MPYRTPARHLVPFSKGRKKSRTLSGPGPCSPLQASTQARPGVANHALKRRRWRISPGEGLTRALCLHCCSVSEHTPIFPPPAPRSTFVRYACLLLLSGGQHLVSPR